MMGKEVENQAEKVLQSASFLRFSPNSSFGSCVCSSNNVFKCCYSSHSHVMTSMLGLYASNARYKKELEITTL